MELFDEIVYDLDKQQIIGFKLKSWAEQFLMVRDDLIPQYGVLKCPL